MQVTRLRWHSPARQQDILLALQRELGAWLRDWSVDPDLLQLCATNMSSPAAHELQWTSRQGTGGSVWLGAPAADWDALGGLLAKASTKDVLGLGTRLGQRAVSALLSQWGGGIGASTERREAPSLQAVETRIGALQFALHGTGFNARLVINGDLCDVLSPVPLRSLAALSRREAVVGVEPVILQVRLDLGRATLSDTAGLAVGDVLVSNTDIDSRFVLSHPDARPIATARLFRAGGQRAIQIHAASPTRTTP